MLTGGREDHEVEVVQQLPAHKCQDRRVHPHQSRLQFHGEIGYLTEAHHGWYWEGGRHGHMLLTVGLRFRKSPTVRSDI